MTNISKLAQSPERKNTHRIEVYFSQQSELGVSLNSSNKLPSLIEEFSVCNSNNINIQKFIFMSQNNVKVRILRCTNRI